MNASIDRSALFTGGTDSLLAYFRNDDGLPPPGCRGLSVETDGAALGRYDRLTLRSAFQPLFDAGSLRAVAHEALLRARTTDGDPVSPPLAFQYPVGAADIVYFDRLCRTVHALNFARQARAGEALFLNVDARHLLSVGGGHGAAFEALLGHCGLSPTDVVLEILESGIDDQNHLADAVASYQRRGYRIAIDDFGCRHSNFDRLWQLSPDIVKLDRSLIAQAAVNPRARLILPKLVEIIHALGAQVVCEGVETAEQHALAVDSGADLLQGYHYARPAPGLRRHPDAAA